MRIEQSFRDTRNLRVGLGSDVAHSRSKLGKRLYVIEINDNPNVDAGNKDSVLMDALYREVMGVFLKRIDAHARGASR